MIAVNDVIYYLQNIIEERSDFNVSSEEEFLNIFFPIETSIQIGSSTLTVLQDRYDRVNKPCDRILRNTNQRLWIEGKKEIKLLPVNDNYITELILLPNDTFFLDIARLTALIDQETDLRLMISLIESDRIEYYRTKLIKNMTHLMTNDNFEIIDTMFCLSDYFPVHHDRKEIVNLSYSVKVKLFIFNKNFFGKKVILGNIESGYVSITVYRDMCDISNEGKTDQYGIGFSGDSIFLDRYFPSS